MKQAFMHYLKVARNVVSGWMPFGGRLCVVCEHKVWRFMPYEGGSSRQSALMKVLDMVGSNVDAFSCPRCGSHDRERHLLMYMMATGILDDLHGKTILHCAPEPHLARRIELRNPANYIRCDLFPTSPAICQIDIQNTDYESDSFDVIIANHVLEHVENDIVALKEIVRILKKGGIAILQTPFSSKLHHTWEDPGISEPDARFQAYGQSDHVRLFGRDIFDRFESAGLISCIKQHAELLPEVDAKVVGVNEAEPFFLFRKA